MGGVLMGGNMGAGQQQTRGNNNLQKNFEAVVELIEQHEVNYDQLHELAEKIAKDIVKDLKLNPTKIRKFYDFVKKVKIMKQLGQEVDLKRDLNRFIAILLYDAGREENKKSMNMKEFAEGMRQIAEKVKAHSKLEYAYNIFVDFFEALVAYHKYYEAVSKKENEREGSER
jgi:CRISPR-associated protein Csm2